METLIVTGGNINKEFLMETINKIKCKIMDENNEIQLINKATI